MSFDITQEIVRLEQEKKDIQNRITQEPSAQIHHQMLAEVQAKIDSLRFQLSSSTEEANPIQAEILKLQAQILAIPTGFSGSGSAARREADNLINVRLDLESQINKLKMQLQAPNKVIPNNEIAGPSLVPNTGQVKQIPLLPIAAGVGIIILAVAITKRKRKK